MAETDFSAVLPNLEARRAALLAELHAERQRDVELSACDQDELAGMHAAIAEQAEELEKLEQGCFEVVSRLEGLEKQETEHREKVEKSKAECDALRTRLEEGRCFSKAEVFRLQGASSHLFFLASSTNLSPHLSQPSTMPSNTSTAGSSPSSANPPSRSAISTSSTSTSLLVPAKLRTPPSLSLPPRR